MAGYAKDETEISLSMLLEVIDALKVYGSDVIVVGGMGTLLPFAETRT